MLAGFSTTFAYHEESILAAFVGRLPASIGRKLHTELERRGVSLIEHRLVETRPGWEIVRTLAVKSGASAVLVDRLWDWAMKDFTSSVAKRISRGDVDLLYAYEYTALEAFEVAKASNIPRVLDFPSLNSRQFEVLQKQQKRDFPELVAPDEAYFEGRFEQRQERRDREASMADMIVTNSTVSRDSHIANGADPDKTFFVNYGAPTPLSEVVPHRADRPLRVLWAGSFNLRKAAHHFVSAWRSLPAGAATADVYGAIKLPDRLLKPSLRGVTFHGSVVRSELFSAYEKADVLVFPTLSDGFGMVVTEAFSRGLPVITTASAGASDLVLNGRNGLIIEADNPDAIVAALEWCLANRVQLSLMRQDALETARRWQWADYRNKLFELVSGYIQDKAV